MNLRAKRQTWLADTAAPERTICVADIGARVTKTAPPYQGLLEAGLAHLYGFEPDAAAFEELQEAAHARATYFQHAVGKPGRATFYSHKVGSLSSVFRFAPLAAKFLGKGFWVKRPIEEIEMALVALDDLPALPRLDILKMDVQGAERDIMEGASDRLSEAVMVIPEVRFYRMYQHEPLLAELDQTMRAQGFVLHKFLFQKSVLLPSSQKSRFTKAARSQLLDGDAVYIRNLEEPERLSTDQLRILALAAEFLIQSHDLCAMCLDQLRAREAVPRNASKRYVDMLPEALAAPVVREAADA